MLAHYQQVRARLMCPPNWRHDRPIDLRRPRGIRPSRGDVAQPRWFTPALVDITSPWWRHEPHRWWPELVEMNIALRIISGLTNADMPSTIPVAMIQRKVCRHYNITGEEMLSNRRFHLLTVPRHVAYYLAMKYTRRSSCEIGRAFRRDHSTIIVMARKIADMIAAGDPIAADVAAIERELGQ